VSSFNIIVVDNSTRWN